MTGVTSNTIEPLLDTCGTGGSGFSTFNTSTAVAFVCAAAGQPVAKHGNRASSSTSGSADVLESLGVYLELSAVEVAECLEQTNFGFMFAPSHHPATKRVARIRKELGFRTIFNFLGPLSNPAGAQYQLLGVSGVSAEEMLPLMAQALRTLGTEHALLVRGDEGLDELSISTTSTVFEVRNGEVSNYQVRPEEFGLLRVPIEQLLVKSAVESAQVMRSMFSGTSSPYADLVSLNAGAALYVSARAESIAAGVEMAKECLASGDVLKKLEQVIAVTSAKHSLS